MSDSEAQQYPMPGAQCLQHVCKLSIADDKPIMLDYWADSIEGKALVGVRESGEKLLVKSEDEYTSPIVKIYKADQEYIVMSENSIYIVSANIPTRRIS